MKDLEQLRQEYSDSGIDLSCVAPNPFVQFSLWFAQASDSGIAEPNGFSLCTISADGKPTQRTVLMKSYTDAGFVFYTNHGSRKAQQIIENNQVSMLFPWYALHRQVHIEGEVSRIGEAASCEYFNSRPRASQTGAWASRQSEPLTSRSQLEEDFRDMERKFRGQDIPLPPFWGGYRIKPERFEFWQGRSHRLHDRIVYRHHQGEWEITRLSP